MTNLGGCVAQIIRGTSSVHPLATKPADSCRFVTACLGRIFDCRLITIESQERDHGPFERDERIRLSDEAMWAT